MQRTGVAVFGVAILAVAIVWWLTQPASLQQPEVAAPAAPAVPSPRPTARPVAATAGPTPASSTEARVKGQVRCEDEEDALPAVEIDFASSGTISTVKAEADGSFVFVTSKFGEWTIAAVRAKGHEAASPEMIFQLAASTTIEDVELRIFGSTKQRGRVVDIQGHPLEGASITSLRRTSVLSDARGEFEIQASGIDFEVTHACCLDAHEFGPENDDELFVITLQPRSKVELIAFEGEVVDEDERCVVGATVAGIAQSSFATMRGEFGVTTNAWNTGRFTLTTDDRGHFTTRLPADAIAYLTASLGTSSSAESEFPATAPARLKLLAHRQALAGLVVDSDGEPVSTFQIRLVSPQFRIARTFYSSDGHYRLENLPNLVGRVEVSSFGFLDGRDDITIVRGKDRTHVDFKLEAGLSLSGVVFDDQTGASVAGAKIRASGFYNQVKNGEAVSDAKGAFWLQGLHAGRIELEVNAERYRELELTVEIGKQQTVRIGLARSSGKTDYAREYEGVGMQFDDLDTPDAGRGYLVSGLHPEGGARVAGVAIGDEILAAGGVKADAVATEDFLRQIKGDEGTIATLTVRRGGQVFDLHAIRRRLSWDR